MNNLLKQALSKYQSEIFKCFSNFFCFAWGIWWYCSDIPRYCAPINIFLKRIYVESAQLCMEIQTNVLDSSDSWFETCVRLHVIQAQFSRLRPVIMLLHLTLAKLLFPYTLVTCQGLKCNLCSDEHWGSSSHTALPHYTKSLLNPLFAVQPCISLH